MPKARKSRAQRYRSAVTGRYVTTSHGQQARRTAAPDGDAVSTVGASLSEGRAASRRAQARIDRLRQIAF